MIADSFLDTTILLHAANGHGVAPAKHAIAQGLLTSNFGTSAQVLAEFYNAATRHGPEPLSNAKAARWIELLTKKPVQPIDNSVALTAIALANEHQLAYWNAAVLAAAEKLGCTTLYSEDLAHGRIYGSVRVVNPFLEVTSSKEG